jgi:hypothetical protein
MSENRKGFIEQIKGVITKPQEAFNFIMGEDLWRGLIIITLIAGFSAWAGMIYTSKLSLNVQISQGGVNIVVLSALSSVITTLTGWLLIHAIAKLTGENGSLKRMFALSGFASIPLLAQQILRLVDAYTITPTALANYQIANSQVTGLIMKIFLYTNLFTIFGLLTLALTTFAVSANYEVSHKKSLIIAVSVYLVLIILQFFM